MLCFAGTVSAARAGAAMKSCVTGTSSNVPVTFNRHLQVVIAVTFTALLSVCQSVICHVISVHLFCLSSSRYCYHFLSLDISDPMQGIWNGH